MVIHFGTNQFLIYDFLLAVNSNFCSRTHRLATIHFVQTTDRRNTAAYYVGLRSAKNDRTVSYNTTLHGFLWVTNSMVTSFLTLYM